MKSLLGIFVVVMVFFFLAPAALAQPGQTISCSSDDMRRNWCNADIRGGVQMVRQRSDAACIFGRTWGYTGRGIWVDKGCRADFQLGGAGWQGWGQDYAIYCASDDGRRNFCPTNTRGGVRLVRKRSDASCDYGRDWGYDSRRLWVDHGCRADFQIGNAGWNPGGNDKNIVYCASDDMGRHGCPLNTRGGVRLIRQRSDADCIYGRTWGFDRRGIWVDRGCRADFETGAFR